MKKFYKPNRYPRPKGRDSLIFAQDSLHPRDESRGFFAQNKRNGFGLVEILLFLVLVMFMTIILITSAGSLNKTRRVNLEAIAAQIASREIETLRNRPFDSLPSCPQPAGCALSDTTDLSKLPAGLGVKFIESNFEENNTIKPITVRISWQDSGVSKQINFDTLISENGL